MARRIDNIRETVIIALNNLIRGKSRQRSKGGVASPRSSILPFLTAAILILNQPAQGAAGTTVYIGQEIQFKNNVKGPEGMTWLWDFGDQEKSTSNIKAPKFKYKIPGEYTVKLTVSIPGVAQKNVPKSNELKIKVQAVTAMIKAEKLKIKVGDEIPFSSEINAPKGTTLFWDFGDGEKGGDEDSPKHRFTKASPDAKPFKVQLKVKVPNIDEKIPSNELLVEVAGMAPPPAAKGKYFIGQDVPFVNPKTNPDTPKYKYKWKFDDGVKEGYTVTHRYLTPGRKRYSLEMYLDDVLTDSGDGYIDILPVAVDPSANGKKKLTVLKGIDEVEFSANTEGPPGMTWSWDFGGGAPTSTDENPKVTFEKHSTNGNPYEVVLTVTVPNIADIISDPILVTVNQKFIKPAIGSITIDRSEIGADGNYTAKIIVEATGTYKTLQLKVEGDPISDITLSSPQSRSNAKGGKHTFTITVPEPPTSVTKAPVAEKLKVIATIFPDDPDDEKKATGYAKTETLNLTLIPQKPGWLLYVYILAGCILLAIIIMLVVLAKRPVVPGAITLNGADHFLTSSPLGPKKGKLEIDLGNLDSDYDGFVMTVSAEKRGNSTQLRINSVINSKNGTEGEVTANSEYFDFGREFPCVETMNIEWSSEERGRLSLTYDTHQSDSYDYGGDQDDETYQN